MSRMLRVFDDNQRRHLIGEGMNWYLTLGHDVYTALHLTGGLRLMRDEVEMLVASGDA